MPLSASGPEHGHSPPKRRVNWWLVAGLSIAAAVAAVLAARALAPGVSPLNGPGTASQGGFVRSHGPAAPSWQLTDLTAPTQRDSLTTYSGHPVVLNFWASWCVPCRTEMPALAAADISYGNRVAFVGIDTNDQRPPALDLARRSNVSYPLAFDPSGGVSRRYGVYGLPTTVFISRTGEIVGRNIGPVTTRRLSQLIAELFPPD